MFRRKKPQEAAPQQTDAPPSPARSSDGYQVVEIPTYDKGKRRVVVYRSDPSGRIIKTFKK